MWNKRINVGISVLTILIVVSLLFPMIQRSREAARTAQSKNNLRQIGLAIHNYESSYSGFPPGGIFDAEGQGYHGWMSSILPYIESSPLYNAIDFNEPWDSTKNAGAFLSECRIYQNPGESSPIRHREFPLAHYSANPHIIAANSFTRLKSIENPERVFLAGELAGDFLPWGCPYNWRKLTGLNSNPPTYGRSTLDGCQFLFVDGRVQFVANGVSPDILKKMSGEDLTGSSANALKIQRPSAFPVPADAVRVSWKYERVGKDFEAVEVRTDIHGNLTTDKSKLE